MEKHEVELLKSELQKLYDYIRKLHKPGIFGDMLAGTYLIMFCVVACTSNSLFIYCTLNS